MLAVLGELESLCVNPRLRLGYRFTQTFEFSQTPSRVCIRVYSRSSQATLWKLKALTLAPNVITVIFAPIHLVFV